MRSMRKEPQQQKYAAVHFPFPRDREVAFGSSFLARVHFYSFSDNAIGIGITGIFPVECRTSANASSNRFSGRSRHETQQMEIMAWN